MTRPTRSREIRAQRQAREIERHFACGFELLEEEDEIEEEARST